MTAPTPTTAQLRSAIDRGQTGEKVAFPDPAAAPLGTDDEAAGNPPTAGQRRLEASSQPAAPETRADMGIAIYGCSVIGVSALLMLAGYLAANG